MAKGNAPRVLGWLALFAAAMGGIGYVMFGGDASEPEAITSIRPPPPPPPTRDPPAPALPPPSVVASLDPDDAALGFDSGGCPDGLVMVDEVYNNAGERGRGCARMVDGGRHVNEGTWRVDEPQGMSMSGTYVRGKRQGTWTARYASGAVFQQVDFVDDKKNGDWIQWTEDGRKVFEKQYRDDRQDGRTLVYLPDGGVEEQTWANGVQVRTP